MCPVFKENALQGISIRADCLNETIHHLQGLTLIFDSLFFFV